MSFFTSGRANGKNSQKVLTKMVMTGIIINNKNDNCY